VAACALAAAVGCAGIKASGDTGTGTGASSGSGATTGSGGAGGSSSGSGGVGSGRGGSVGTSGSGGGPPICDMFTINFVPKVPTVFVLVDRSGTIFRATPDLPNGVWAPLRAATLQVVNSLQSQI